MTSENDSVFTHQQKLRFIVALHDEAKRFTPILPGRAALGEPLAKAAIMGGGAVSRAMGLIGSMEVWQNLSAAAQEYFVKSTGAENRPVPEENLTLAGFIDEVSRSSQSLGINDSMKKQVRDKITVLGNSVLSGQSRDKPEEAVSIR